MKFSILLLCMILTMSFVKAQTVTSPYDCLESNGVTDIDDLIRSDYSTSTLHETSKGTFIVSRYACSDNNPLIFINYAMTGSNTFCAYNFGGSNYTIFSQNGKTAGSISAYGASCGYKYGEVLLGINNVNVNLAFTMNVSGESFVVPERGLNTIAPAPKEIVSNVSGSWYDPDKSGLGFNVIQTANNQLVAYFYGYKGNGDGDAQWLLTEALSTNDIEAGKTYALDVYAGYAGNGGSFTSAPTAEGSGISDWGSLDITFHNCTAATASLNGSDGVMSFNMTKLANLKGADCGNTTQVAPFFNINGSWYDRSKSGLGFNVIQTANDQLVSYFYGYKGSSNGDAQWLLTEALPVATIVPGQTYTLNVYAGYEGNGGSFTSAPTVEGSGISDWGTLQITFDSCTSASATLTGDDGEMSFDMVKLANLKGATCVE